MVVEEEKEEEDTEYELNVINFDKAHKLVILCWLMLYESIFCESI